MNLNKTFRVYAIFENVIDLKTGNLHGYRLVSRIYYGNNEVSFIDLYDKELKANIERRVLDTLKSLNKNVLFFIPLPISITIESLPIYGINLVVNLPIGMGFKNIYEHRKRIKNCGLMTALDDFTTIGYELKEVTLGTFDYVFLSDEFYMQARKSDLKKVVDLFKYFGSKVCFKKIDSKKKLDIALEVGSDLGHGYIFGYEDVKVDL